MIRPRARVECGATMADSCETRLTESTWLVCRLYADLRDAFGGRASARSRKQRARNCRQMSDRWKLRRDVRQVQFRPLHLMELHAIEEAANSLVAIVPRIEHYLAK